MSVELIAELATAHGGDVDLACDMVQAAADAGAHTVKLQAYTLLHLNKQDPQYEWLRHSALDYPGHEAILKACQRCRVDLLFTAFDAETFQALLQHYNVRRIKVASTQPIWPSGRVSYIKSWAWGRKPDMMFAGPVSAHLTAIPLYPTPLEAINTAPLLDGWSDHTIGTTVCKHMISRGATIIEAHFCLPGRSRQMPWDKTPEQFREIRDWADAVDTMQTGISQQFRDRWRA